MRQLVITDWQTVSRGDVSYDGLREWGNITAWPLTAANQTAERIADADAVFCNKTRLFADVLEKAPNLKYIGLFATGYNNIDIAYCRAHGITVCNAGSYSTNAVAQHVFACILNKASYIADYAAFTQNGGWNTSPTFSPFVFPAVELAGKTLGIVGYGSIGRAVAEIALAFQMRVVVYTRTPKDDKRVTFTDFPAMLSCADYITVHCPLTEQTRHMFDFAAFSRCKRGAYFVNTSRGGVLVEQDLRRALEEGLLSGAAVDVLEQEPQQSSCALIGAPNLTVTPHVAWAPLETRRRLMGIVEDNYSSFLEGTPVNVVS